MYERVPIHLMYETFWYVVVNKWTVRLERVNKMTKLLIASAVIGLIASVLLTPLITKSEKMVDLKRSLDTSLSVYLYLDF